MTYILGISCYYHDAAACLLKDGEVIVAAEEERFSRIKHDSSFPARSIAFCLEFAHIKSSDLDYVVFNEKPFLKLERIVKTIIATYPLSGGLFQETVIKWMGDKLWIKSLIEEKLGMPKDRILFCEHHLSHAAATFFCSDFRDSAILNCDGVGEWATTTLGSGTAAWDENGKNEIQLLQELRFPHSLGLLYSAFTAFLGFEVNEGEYKVMGMAAFGKPKYTDKVYKVIRVNADGSFRLRMEYFSFHYHLRRSFNRRFTGLFGPPKDPASRFVISEEASQYYADVASSIQKVTEDILVRIANGLYRKTGLKKLSLGGGVALNCVANTRILKETPFEEIFIQPSAGDGGAAMGAALYVHHCLLKNQRRFILKHAYWGKEYSDSEIKDFLKKTPCTHQHIENEDELLNIAVDALVAGKVVGWFQGRFEWGPRALGNRSILADPRQEKMQDIVNTKIKFREPFRPFASSVLSEESENYFDFGKARGQAPLKFMLLTVPVKQKDVIPAVTHVDGTSRVQVVDSETNPLFYRLIKRFHERTGVAVLLNTSFNLKGEPIVESPSDAFSTFARSEIDVLVLGHFLLTKS